MRWRIRTLVWYSMLGVVGFICFYVLTTKRLTHSRLRVKDLERQAMLMMKIHGEMNSSKEKDIPPGHQVCQLPRLQEGHWRERAIRKNPTFECVQKHDWVEVVGSVARIKSAVHEELSGVECDFTPIMMGDDMTSRKGLTTTTANDYVFTESDFAKVECWSATGDEWSSFLSAIRLDHRIREVAGWHHHSTTSFPLNVLILGFHSLSRIMFMNDMPKTYTYLLDTLGGEMMEGYNAVGEGKRSALIPLLTGHDELELPDLERTESEDAVTLDDYPFIWKEFRRAGYVTGFMEDTASLSTSSQELNGFKNQPTDHYTRPFYLEASRNYSDYPDFCLGRIPRHKVMMNNVQNFYNSYRDVPKFLFSFFEELNSNHSHQLMKMADNDMFNWLQVMKLNGHLDKTLLVFVSDHGQLHPDYKVNLQGRLEERLPFLSLVFPSWFKNGHQRETSNLRTNAHRLTTPYDLHATLAAILDNTGDDKGAVTERGISLLREVPLERTCEHAFIPVRWCACLAWSQVDLSEYVITLAASKLIAEINTQTQRYSCCDVQHLKRVLWAAKLTPTLEQLKDKTEQLKDKTEQLKDNAEQLKDKADQLTDKVEQLTDKAEQLKDEADQLKDKAEEVTPRAEQLKPKADQLKSKAEHLEPKVDELKYKAVQFVPISTRFGRKAKYRSVSNTSTCATATDSLYLLRVTTIPGKATYDGLLEYNDRTTKMCVKASDIQRVNYDWNKPPCSLRVPEDIRKLCVCRGIHYT